MSLILSQFPNGLLLYLFLSLQQEYHQTKAGISVWVQSTPGNTGEHHFSFFSILCTFPSNFLKLFLWDIFWSTFNLKEITFCEVIYQIYTYFDFLGNNILFCYLEIFLDSLFWGKKMKSSNCHKDRQLEKAKQPISTHSFHKHASAQKMSFW